MAHRPEPQWQQGGMLKHVCLNDDDEDEKRRRRRRRKEEDVGQRVDDATLLLVVVVMAVCSAGPEHLPIIKEIEKQVGRCE